MSMHLLAQSRPKAAIPCITPIRTGTIQRKCCEGKEGTTGECEDCRQKRLGLQRYSTDKTETNSIPSIVHEVLRSPGQPLDGDTRSFMESRFGHDFGKVRVHTDGKAAESARAVNALAYTVGNDIVLGAGQFAHRTSLGCRLVAHELTHVIQQETGASNSTSISSPADLHEREAESVADTVAAGMSGVIRSSGTAPPLQRQGLQLTPPSILQPPEQRPRAHLLPGLELHLHLLPGDLARIDSYLQMHAFSVGPGLRPSLDGRLTTLNTVVDFIHTVLLPINPRNEIDDYVGARWNMMALKALTITPPSLPPIQVPPIPDGLGAPSIFDPTPPVPSPAPSAATRPITVSVGVNRAWHINLVGPRYPSSDTTLQLQFGEDVQLQRVLQVSYNFDTGQRQALIGGQWTSKDLRLVGELLKLNGFVQILAGVAWTGSPASGTFDIVQPSAGGQLTLTIRGVQFAIQAAVSVTGTQGQPPTGELNVTPQVTIPLP